jgi:outer membrane protein W
MYSIAQPLGNTADYIGETSFRGFAVYGDFFVNDMVSLGFSTGIQTFYEEMGTVSVTENTLTVTGAQFRYLNMIPVIFMGKYHFNRFSMLTPHVGLGLGFNWVGQRVEFAGIQFNEDAFPFAIQPEAGLGIELSPRTDFVISVTYHQSFEARDIDAQSFLAGQVGLRFIP